MPLARQLGRYQLLDRIAVGGMAEVYRAKTFDHKGGVHIVAVKRLRAHVAGDSDFMRSLVDEAKLAAALRHPNISRVYELGHAGDQYFLAMEWVDGKDLRALLERTRSLGIPIPVEHATFIAMEIAAALAAAHAHRDASGRHLEIVHRDVSPANALVSYAGEVKLCDFGIAKARMERDETRTGIIKGKAKYMSPEQASGKKLDHRSDLFSLGSVLYELLSGRPPFAAKTDVDIVLSVRAAKPESLRSVNPLLPAALCGIVERAMSKSRSRRFQSGQDLSSALREVLNDLAPTYKRSSLSRFMRRLFVEEIDRELRALEDYVIDSGIEEAVTGENLLADALPRNAPYRHFTPDPSGARPMPRSRGDLHAENTLILSTADRVKTPPGDRDHRASVPPPPRKHVTPQPRPPASEIPTMQTQILPRIDEARRLRDIPTQPSLPTVIVDFGPSVHDVKTQLLPRVDTPTEPREDESDKPTDKRPRNKR